MDDLGEAASGDHDEAFADVGEVGVFFGVFLAMSIVLTAAKLGAGLPIDWDFVAAPALVPLLVLAVVLPV